MANVKVIVHEEGLAQFLRENQAVRSVLLDQANKVKSTAESTASDAQKGAGGTISGYAEAGFRVEWVDRGGKRPHVNVISNTTDAQTLTRVYFYTQKRDGVTHLRKALYEHTTRG